MLFISPCTIYLNTEEKGHLFALLNDVTDVENAVKSHHVVDEGIVGNPVHVHEQRHVDQQAEYVIYYPAFIILIIILLRYVCNTFV